MFDLGGVSSGNVGSNYSPGIGGENQISGEEFLMLLVAQLQYQDPMEPISNQEYVSQLTEISSLEELQKITSELKSQQANAQTQINAQSLGMIGREVTVVDDTLEHQVGQETELQFELPSNETVLVTIYNGEGQAVRQDMVTSSMLSGWQSYTFDGRSDHGTYLPDGTYYVSVTTPPDEYGDANQYPVFQSGRVTGVDFSGETPILELEGNRRVPLTNVTGVREVL